jgi:phosphoglycerol transferase MdoB-like AlkP superfamily enzyme
LPAWLTVFFFLLFVAANALKTSLFYCILIDVSVVSSFHVLFQSLFRNLVIGLFIYLFLTRPRHWCWLAGFYFIHTFYMFINLAYHLSLGGLLRFSQYIGLYAETIDLVQSTVIPYDSRLWLVIADLPFFVILLLAYHKFSKVNSRVLFRPAAVCAAVTVFAVLCVWNPLRPLPKRYMPDTYSSDAALIQSYGLFAFTVRDILSFRKTHEFALSQRYGPLTSFPGSDKPRPDIFCIQIESLDANIIDQKHDSVFVMPFLHNLSDACVFFPYALSYHEAGLTTDCEISVINSMEPLADFPSMKLHNFRYTNSMVKQFSKVNYQAIAFHGNRGTFNNRIEAYAKMGFGTFYDITGMHLRETAWGAPDGAVFDFVKEQFGAHQGPLFYYVITMSSHEPFTLVDSYFKNTSFSTVPNKITRAYFNSMSYVDKEVGDLVARIRAQRPNSYCFIYGDHTPITQVGDYKKASFLLDDRLFEFVPLFVITPDSIVHREGACVASFIDVAPTALIASQVPYRLRTNGANLLDFPLHDGVLTYRNGAYSRTELFQMMMSKEKGLR